MPYSNKEKQREYYRVNKEKISEYYQLNKEKRVEYDKKYKEKNKKKISEYYKGYNERNKAKLREQKAEYRELNKEKIREQKREYNKKKRAICLEYLGGKCVKCGTTERLEFDHIKRDTKKYNIAPRVTYNFDYLKEELDKCQLLCPPCHLNKTASEWTK